MLAKKVVSGQWQLSVTHQYQLWRNLGAPNTRVSWVADTRTKTS